MALVVMEPTDLKELVLSAVADAIQQSSAPQSSGPEWLTLRAACERKGLSYNSAKSKPRLQPRNGVADGRLSGRRVWHSSTIESWLSELDL